MLLSILTFLRSSLGKVAIAAIIAAGFYFAGHMKGKESCQNAQLEASLKQIETNIKEANAANTQSLQSQIDSLNNSKELDKKLAQFSKRIEASIEKNARYESKDCALTEEDIKLWNELNRVNGKK